MANWSIRSSASDLVKAKSILSRAFFERDTVQVARELLGKVLIVRSDPIRPGQKPWGGRLGEFTAGRIVETEAYHGSDPASHSARGQTPRSAIMFGEPGVAYVYFIYGMYEMLNFVTEKKGYPGAVLIRALEPLSGVELMSKRRASQRDLANGPGRLCQAMGIKMEHNGESLAGPVIYVVDDGNIPKGISASPRVGISWGKEDFWRYFITDSAFVSKAPQNALARRI